MKTLKKAVGYVGRVVALILGGDFPTPRDTLTKNHPRLAFGW